jgi:methylmalonyl-CoA/ethylmalonyl-CoA epimerase
MINKVEHLGIAVKDIDSSNKLFAKLLGKQHYKTEFVESESVITSFFKIGEQKIELLQTTDERGLIAKFIEKRKEGVHHLAFHVDSLEEEIKRLKKEGFRVELDLRNEKIGSKIRDHTLKKVPYLIIIGDKEVEDNILSVRSQNGKDLGKMSLDELLEILRKEISM